MYQVTSDHELFVDDFLVERLEGVSRRLCPVSKHPANPIFTAGAPWDHAGPALNGGVICDDADGLFKMWHRSGEEGAPEREAGCEYNKYWTCMCLAVSEDGLRWRRPDCGVSGFYTNPRTNIVIPNLGPHWGVKGYLDHMGVVKDPHDPDPARRYKTFVYHYNKEGKRQYIDPSTPFPSGLYAGWSQDGVHWTIHPKPVLRLADGIGDCSGNLMVDARQKRYITFVRLLKGPRGGRRHYIDGKYAEEGPPAEADVHDLDTGLNRDGSHGLADFRFRAISESSDFLHWSDPKEIVPPDSRDPEGQQWHNNSGFVYGSQYLGLLESFVAPLQRDTTEKIDIQLISSRDGTSWERCPDRSAFIPNGVFDRDWDWGLITVPNTPPIRVGDKLFFYYTGHATHHGQAKYRPNCPNRANLRCMGIGLATLRVDGFMALSAPATVGSILTKPFFLDGTFLEVNAAAGHGEVRVGVLDENGRELPGYEPSACRPLQSDSVRSQIRWKERSSIAELRGKAVRLIFKLQAAELYSFWVV